MNKTNKFSPEVRERAVRLVQEHRGEYPSLWAAVESIAPKIGCVSQTLLEWVKRDEIDGGKRDGVTSVEHERIGNPPMKYSPLISINLSVNNPESFYTLDLSDNI
jgi:transposase